MDPVVEHAEIGLGRAGAGTEQEGGLGELLGGAAGFAFGGEGIAHHQLIAALGIFAHDTTEIGCLDLLGELVVDVELLGRLGKGEVDLLVPGLLDRGGEDRGNLELLVGGGESRQWQAGGNQTGCAEPDEMAARQA